MSQTAHGASIATLTLGQREEQLRLAIDAAEVGLWDVDVATNALYWPARVKAMFGISPDATATLDDFVACLHPQDAEHVLRAYADCQDPALRTVYDVEYRTIGKEDGVLRWVAAKGRGLFNDQGECVRAIGTAIDITARKQSEAAAERGRRRLELLNRIEHATRPLNSAQDVMEVTTRLLGEHLEATRCAYADVEPDNNRFTIRADWSPNAPSSVGVYSLELFGSLATSNLRMGRHLVVDDVDRDLGDEGGARMFNAIGIKAIVCAGLVKRGLLVAMMAVHQAEPRQWNAEDLEIITEVVDRCWAHIERVRDAAALRLQDRRKDEFLATLAHELRNPIAPMLYAIALMKREKDPARLLSRTEVIERQTSHLVRLVDDLLDVSRISRGVVELKREVLDISTLLVQAVEAAQPGVNAARHSLKLSLPQVPAPVLADPSRIVQIATNLLNNAVKYTPDGGELSLSCKVDASRVVIEVSDNGLGIPAPDQSRLFDLFTQLPHTGAKAHGGLGIGFLPHALRRTGPAATLCDTGTALHARRAAGGPARHRPGLLPPCPGQSPRPDAWTAAGCGQVRRLALDHRTLPSLRLLHGERRRRGAGAGRGGARARLRGRAGLPARRRGRLAAPRRRHGPQRPRLRQRRLRSQGPGPVAMAGLGPSDVGSVQSYENFTGGVVMALAEHGFFRPEEANDFLTVDNLVSPHGRLPLNTSGGKLAECYMHGLELVLEAVRQVRGTSTSQAPRRDAALVIGAPMVWPVSNLLLGSEATL